MPLVEIRNVIGPVHLPDQRRGKFCGLLLTDDAVTLPRISALPSLACDMSASIDRLFFRLLFMYIWLCFVLGRIKRKCVNILFVNSFVNRTKPHLHVPSVTVFTKVAP
jgi:hypothetical protein